ncbi:MAG: CAP domain-containing protein [Terriglobia bacterium]
MCWRTRWNTLLLATLLALPGGTAVLAGDTTLDHREQFILSEINRIRAEQGLSQLRLNNKLCAMALSHSSDMAGTGRFSHTDSLGRDFRERLGNKTVERYHAGENLATNNFPDAARVAVEGWRQSPKHLKNILNEKFTETGIGVAVNPEGLVFLTQIFLGK